MEPPIGASQNGFSYSNSTVHHSAVGSSWNKMGTSARSNGESKMQGSHMPQTTPDPSNSSLEKDEGMSAKEPIMVN